jgi:hypothetical protein
MISIDKFLSDEQDPKAVERVLGKLQDMLTSNEELLYMAVQKKPAVNLLPDCIAVSNKRIFYCEPGNFGITMNFKDISWKSIKEVSFKEEFFGSKFICVPQQGENIVTEYIPKVQARKLYQTSYEHLEDYKEQQRLASSVVTEEPQPVPEQAPEPVQDMEDELTLKLIKLKTLYDKQLITQEEYEAKKATILDSL